MTADGMLLAHLEGLLARLDVDRLEHPGWLLWLFAAALVPVFARLRATPPAVPWPGAAEAAAAGARRFDLLTGFAVGMRLLCLLCLALVIAGPLSVQKLPPRSGLGLDIVLVVDTSESMAARDAMLGGTTRTRLDLALEAVARFATRRVAEGDRIGLVVFGDTAFTQCPLTHDGALLVAALGRVEVGIAGEATALGDALALAVKRASASSGDTQRIVVLLSDGRSNAGEVPVSVARELAAGAGLRVHTVAIGTSGHDVPMEAGLGMRFERHDPDHIALRAIAEHTGGRFYAARESSDLRAVYDSIDTLERSERPLPRRSHERPRPEPLLAASGTLLLLEILFVRVFGRRLE